jgi:phosphatidylethanolamine-binding protein
MAAHVDPLVVGRVIGDVVDLFVPSVAVSVRFGTKDLTNGCEIKPSVAAAPPAVRIAGWTNDLFTLVGTISSSSQQLAPRMLHIYWFLPE